MDLRAFVLVLTMKAGPFLFIFSREAHAIVINSAMISAAFSDENPMWFTTSETLNKNNNSQ